MENGSLHDILHEKNPPPPLSWNVRFKIAVGVAQGLEYLHYDCIPPIVHRDIKPKNILLDADMEPLIADFGIALRRGRYEHSISCQPRQTLSAYVAGTVGYIAPENAYAIVQSRKSDVYSYGVVLLELLTRKKVLVPSLKDNKEQETHLVSWARSIWLETGEIEKIVDPDLAIAFSYSVVVVQQVTEVLMLALRCTERNARNRPTMKDVMNFYERTVFKVRCDNVDSGTEVVADVAPQPSDHHLHGESSRAANLRQAVNSSLVGLRFKKKNTYCSLQDLVLEATEDLNDCYIIGRAAHGIFYKAQVGLQLVLAVKMVAFGRDRKNISIMLKEIQTTRMMKHPNLVSYADCWIGQSYGLVLYEYIENGSLHDILHEKCPPPFLTWNVRLKIAVGIAHRLAHLHNDRVLPIVHGDIKSKNILLDVDMEPLIADFRSAQYRCCNSDSDCQLREVLSMFVDGNQAIVQDEAYADVYSYGVVLLELLTRKKVFVPSFKDEEEHVTTLVSWVTSVSLETRGKIEKIVDSDLASAFSDSVIVAKQVTAVLMLALRCTDGDQWKRPKMKDVVNFYQKPMFKERWDNVVHGTEVAADAGHGTEVAADAAPQPCNSLSLFSDIPVVSINSVSNTQGKVTFNVETEPEDSNDFTWWQDANQYELGVYAWDDWKLMSTPTTGIAGLVIKQMGNVKIQARQVLVAALIIPKITYSWPYLIFLPSEIGPVLTKPFNWFFLSCWAQYMHLQKTLYAQPKSCFITPIKATLQLSNHGRIREAL